MKNIIFIVGLTIVLSGGASYAVQPENMGTVNITVMDDKGGLVSDAPIYIFGEHKTKFNGGKEVAGSTPFAMPEGDYIISSSIVKKTGDYVDRFASHEAHIQVVAGDNSVVVLTLRPITDTTADLDLTELSKMGITTEIALNLN